MSQNEYSEKLLSKPEGQECGNCYYCVSHIEIESRITGFFTPMESREHEVFNCRRYPPLKFIGRMTSIPEIDVFTRIPRTSKIHWCGEWRTRKAGAEHP